MSILVGLIKQLVSFGRFALFVLLSTVRGLVVGLCRIAAPFFILGGALALILGADEAHYPLALGAIGLGLLFGILAYGYDRLLLALQPRGTDVFLID